MPCRDIDNLSSMSSPSKISSSNPSNNENQMNRIIITTDKKKMKEYVKN